MIENNQKYSGIIKLILDVLIICLSYFAALYIVFRDQMSYYIKAVSYIPILIAIVPIFAIIYKNFHLYNKALLYPEYMQSAHHLSFQLSKDHR